MFKDILDTALSIIDMPNVLNDSYVLLTIGCISFMIMALVSDKYRKYMIKFQLVAITFLFITIIISHYKRINEPDFPNIFDCKKYMINGIIYNVVNIDYSDSKLTIKPDNHSFPQIVIGFYRFNNYVQNDVIKLQKISCIYAEKTNNLY